MLIILKTLKNYRMVRYLSHSLDKLYLNPKIVAKTEDE